MDQSSDNVPPVSTEEAKPAEKSKKSFIRSRRGFTVAVIAGAFLFSFLGNLVADQYFDQDSGTRQVATSGEDGNKIISQDERDIATVAETVSPSVVSISTATSSQYRYGIQQEGAGTGVIVSSDGYILTNKHVIDGVSLLEVVLENGKKYDQVRVVATDPLNDIAFLKINGAKDLPVANLGDSSTIQIGQQVVAIGNSLGQYQNTVTSGIISGTNRPVAAQAGNSVETLTDLIQTDAAINPGNSGGPLVNMAGQVIGINTAIAADAEGIGFAIPINATKGMLKGLLENGKAERPYLGVNYLPINGEVAAEYNLSVDNGAYIYADRDNPVQSGSPADEAGVKEGDIITKVEGVEVGPGGGVATLIGAYAPGDKINITILRDGKERNLEVTLAAYPN